MGNASSLPRDALHLKGHSADIKQIALLPGGESIATASSDQTVRVFSLTSGACTQTFEGHDDFVMCVLAIDADIIVSVGLDRKVCVWSLSGDELLRMEHFYDIASSCALLGGGRFVIGGVHGALHEMEWNGRRLRSRRTVQAHAKWIRRIAVHSGRFATASGDTTAKVFDATTLQCLHTFSESIGTMKCVALNDVHIVTGSYDGTLRVYDARSFQLMCSFRTHAHSINDIHFVDGGDAVLSGSEDQKVVVNELRSDGFRWRMLVGFEISLLAVLPDGRVAACGGKMHDVLVFSTPGTPSEGRPLREQDQMDLGGSSRHVGGAKYAEADSSRNSIPQEALRVSPPSEAPSVLQLRCKHEFEVFISHAGPDKRTMAYPLYHRVGEIGVSSFLDQEELRPGDDSIPAMRRAMNESPILVAILSPEFCARVWTMREVNCFLERDEKAKAWASLKTTVYRLKLPMHHFGFGDGRASSDPKPGQGGRPFIIPVFYRLGVGQCRHLDLLKDVTDGNRYNMKRYRTMVNNSDPEVQQIKKSMHTLGGYQGIENTTGASNEDTSEMEERRSELVALIVKAVVRAIGIIRAG